MHCVGLTHRTRALRLMRDLQPGTAVVTPDGEEWVVQSTSSFTCQTNRDKKWLWLRRGNTYRKVNGNDFYTLRLIVEKG